jgi:hypothetical protein
MPNFVLSHKTGLRRIYLALALCCGSASSPSKNRTTGRRFAQCRCAVHTVASRLTRHRGGNRADTVPPVNRLTVESGNSGGPSPVGYGVENSSVAMAKCMTTEGVANAVLDGAARLSHIVAHKRTCGTVKW